RSRRPSTLPSSTTDIRKVWSRPAFSLRGGRACAVNRRMTDGDEPPAILAEAVSKRYGAFTAVERLDLHVRRGEVFCLLGPNGSGKTPSPRMLAGYLAPWAGGLLGAGHDVVRDGLAAKTKIGYVPESVPLYSHMRMGEFLRFMARLRRVPAAEGTAAGRRGAGMPALTHGLPKPTRAPPPRHPPPPPPPPR